MNPLLDALHRLLLSVEVRDKKGVEAAARTIDAALFGVGPTPIRHHLRATEAGADISNWGVATHHARAAILAAETADRSALG